MGGENKNSPGVSQKV